MHRIGSSTARIAIVEDDVDAREVIADLLREEGFDVVTFGDGAEALAGLCAGPPPDLILLDLRLPGMDGWEFRVRQKRDPHLAQVPVIALSADRSSQAQAIDADEFLEKPPRLEQLLSTVGGVLERAAEKRRRATQMALESMAALGQLAAGVAHEINNPLAYVCGNLYVLREEIGRLAADGNANRAVFAEIDAMLRESLAGAERIRDIVRDMRLLARTDETSAPVDLHEALDAAIGVAKNLALGRSTIVRRYDDPPDVLGSHGRLVHAFFNLIANALQAIPEGRPGGEVIVETSETPDGRARVRVIDNGVGIPRESLGRIFEPFFTTRAVGLGRGLGLSVTTGIVSALGGTVDVESEVGVGSTFTVTLPPATAEYKRSQLVSAPVPRRLRVLVIDDDPAIGRVLTRMLRDEFDVTVASSGRDGLKGALSGAFDAILCDLVMEDVGGVDVFKAVADARPGDERRIVFMSDGAPGGKSVDVAKVAGNRIVDKPLDGGTVLHALRAAAGIGRT